MKLSHITKTYKSSQGEQVIVFDDLDIVLPDNGLSIILGESGIGKTTLFNMMTQNDLDYFGKIENQYSIEYLNQQVEFFENLSVIENLRIVCEDINRINKLIDKFCLRNLQNKKVKKLSLGERRRVQLIRALLFDNELLLCDEPTASVDEENAMLIWETLKEISKEKIVYVATHDSLAYEYADYIYQIENKSMKCLKESVYQERSPVTKKEFPKNYQKTTLLFHKAHFISHITTVFLLICMIISLYSTLLYTNASGKELERQSWLYSQNLIQSIPKESGYAQYYERNVYTYFDTYSYDDLEKTIDNQKDIIGYTWQVDTFNYDYYNNNKLMDRLTKTYHYTVKDDWKVFTMPYTTKVILSDLYKVSDDISLDGESAFVYQMIDMKQVPLKYGQYPKADSEVIVDEATAKLYDENIENIVGKDISINVTGPDSVESLSQTVKIVGVTTLENAYENRMYFQDKAFMKLVSKACDVPYENMTYNVVKYLVNPSADTQKVVQKIDNDLSSSQNKIKVYDVQDSIYQAQKTTIQSQSYTVLIASLIIFAFSLVGIIVNQFYFKKQYVKEKHILEEHHYLYKKIENRVNIGISIIVCMIALIIIPLIISVMNGLTQTILLELDVFKLGICSLIVVVVYHIVIKIKQKCFKQ